MEKKYLYILLNPVANHILTKGLDFFLADGENQPSNLILLNHSDYQGQFDDYTRFHVVLGRDRVSSYLNRQEGKKSTQAKWVDFKSYNLLHRLQASEIAELLYLSHMDQAIRSPFFYKLQNRFVYLPVEHNYYKIYYRYIDDFYRQIAQALRRAVSEGKVDKASAFKFKRTIKNKPTIQAPSQAFIEKLYDYFTEGVIIDLGHLTGPADHVELPLIVAWDQIEATLPKLSTSPRAGTITYNFKTGTWTLKEETNK
ncbi:hypothetical protein [Aerococcus kribbianus]|uniref:Uncharacterized protein n=1 Tax=Aerococcus kribbianus TaxID=2999064 RepID=A0A9X3FNU1_9LACT|nr:MULTISPECIES: hypothetical protein [unclassified Aerococcus]MCZ0717886.1 hypothetical protein [Aerococcus sp. YH-aer221]MCZ0726173.1 hypothetical protein [Aerococcus sp. YH-aer222]